MSQDSSDASGRMAGWGFASNVAAAGLSYVLQLVVGRLMAPALYSETQALLAIYMMLTMPAVPLMLPITRRIVQDGEPAAIHAFVRGLTWRTGAGCGIALAIVLAARAPLADALAITTPSAVPLLALAIVANVLYLIAQAALLGRVRWRPAVALPVAFGIARLVLSVLFVLAGYGVAGVLAAIAIGHVACLIVAYALAVQGLPAPGRYRPLPLVEVGMTAALTGAFWFLVHVDTVYVNRALPDLAARGYAAAATLARPVVYFPAAVNQVLFPLLVLAATGPARRAVLGRMTAAAAATSLIGMAVTVAAPGWLLTLTFGPAYAGAAGTLPAITAVLAPFSIANIVLYDALARQDRGLTRVFVVVALAAGLLLLTTRPPLSGLFALLATSAGVMVVAGVVRSRKGRAR